jgi:four helix bundle protein
MINSDSLKRVQIAVGTPKVKGMVNRPRRATLDFGSSSGVEGGMNESEVIMHDANPGTEFIAHSKAIEAAGIALRLVSHLPVAYRSLADQVIRSASSVPANLNEGLGRVGKDRAYHWQIAYGSAREVDSHLQLLLNARAIDPHLTDRARGRFDEVRAIIWRLLHPVQ